MKKEIKLVDKKNNIFQITCLDERWYSKPAKDTKTGLPIFEFKPSSSWICSYYPKGIEYMKWLASKGWDEAEALKEEGGNYGSMAHHLTELYDNEEEIKLSDKYTFDQDIEPRELDKRDCENILSYQLFSEEKKPEHLVIEKNVFSDIFGFGGTLDRLSIIEGELYLIDIKTSTYIWASHKIQLSSYKKAIIEDKELVKLITDKGFKVEDIKLAILQIGYGRNKNGYKFTEIEDKFDLFLSAKSFWAEENSEATPSQKDYPLIIKKLETLNKK